VIIHEGDIFFNDVVDPIKTEETIFHQLKHSAELPLDYVAVPLAYRLNRRGIENTQNFINEINSRHPQRKFFVCQHIWVNLLDFGENLVFTPHTINSDQFCFIPHYNANYSEKPDLVEIQSRKIDFSFMGDYGTNDLRAQLSQANHPNSFFKNTELWFFSHSEGVKSNLKSEYKKLLESTKFALCPPGTGPSTLRLFEAMSVGCIPIIFNDLKIPPDLEGLIIKSSHEDFSTSKIRYILEEIDISKISGEILEVYWERYSNQRLSQSILLELKNKKNK
jgi:hypothetical protein